MAGALENRGKNRGLALAQKKAKEKNKTGALTLRGQDRDKKNRGGLAGGIGYVAGNLGLGLANVGEGILDISMAAGDLLQGDTDMAKYRFLDNMSGNAQKRLQEDYNPNGAMKLAGDVASGIGNSLTFLIPYAGPYLAAAGYMGMGVSSAAERTGDVGAKELGYGVVSGGMEFLMDKFIGASGRAYKSIGASITRKLGREAAEAGAKATAKLAGKSFGKAVLTETLKGAAGEALEEASQEALDPVLLRLFNIDENAKLDWKNVAYAGLVGGLSGGLMTAGPAAINYKSAASAGKSIRESGETAEFLEHARLVVKGAQRKQANLTAKKDAAKAAKETKTEDGTDTAKAEKTKGGIGTFIQGRRDAKASRRVAQLAETVQKNLTAYEGYLNKADKTAKELEISDAILGEMRGNVFLLENAALLESYEEAILELSDEDKAELVADINARAKASGAEKTDYTVEDLNKDTDGILAGVAGNYLLSENYGRYLRGNQEAKAADTSESPAEAAEGEETVTGEEVEAEPNKSAEEAPEVKREAAPKRKGTVTVSDGMKPSKDFSDTQYAAYKAAEILSGSTGMDIEIHRDLTRNGKDVNGYYDRGTKVLHVNINAMRDGKHIALYTLGHEATHYIKDWSPEKFNVLADFVAKQMGTDMQTAVNEKLSSLFRLGLMKNLTAEQASELAREEVVADGMELIFTDGKVLEELAKTDKTLWEKIRDWFFDVIEQIRSSYRGLNQESKTAQVLRESMETLDEVERLFTEGVRDAGERAAEIGKTVGNGNEIIYSSTENFKEDKYFKSQMAKWENLKHGSYVKVGTLGEGSPLCQVGMPSGTIRYDVDKLKRNMTDHDDYLTVELLNEIPNILANPVAISEYSQENTISVFGDVFVGKSPMMVGVTISHDRAGNEISKVRTYNTRRDVGNLITDETVLYLGEDKKRTREWFQACGIQVPLGGTKFGFIRSIAQRKYSVNSKFSISENIPSTLSAEDQNLLFDADFYERYENENREPITETVKELETIKESEAFATMSDDEMFELNAKLKAKRAGYDTVYDYYVETEKERMAEEYRRYVQTGRSNRTSRTLEEKRKKAQKERTLRSDMDSATPLQNAQYKIIQETNPMWDEYHTGIRSPKEIKTFAEVAEDHDSFTWGDFTREDAEKALREGKVRVYSSYAIKNGVFVSTSYNQALQYAGNNPDGVHTRVVALDSVAWINGDEGQYAKVYKDDGISYSIDDSGEVSGSEAADNQAALEKFGTTTDFEQAGFAMADGRMLKLSQYGQRGVQHRVIEGIYQDTKGDEAIARFIQNGNVRISAASPGIEISAEKPLTTNQLNVISRFASKSLAGRGSFYLDITGRNGESIASVAYDDRQSAAAIIEDIKDYYKRGRVPEESRYLYSIDEEGENRELSDTELLGMALEGVVQSEQEYKIVSDFREKARLLDLVRQHKSEYARQASAYEKQIRELKARMDESGDPDGWIRKAYSDTIAKKREAERMRDEQDSILDHEARELLRLRAAKPFREVIAREQRRAKAAERREQKAKAEYEFREEYKENRREMSVRERVARRVVGRMNTMFYNPTKTKHVPADLQALVEAVLKSEKLDTFKETRKNLRQMAEMESEIEKLEQNPARTAKEQEELDKLHYKYAMFEDEGMDAKSQAVALYTAFKEWMERRPPALQDKALLEQMSADIDAMQDMPLSVMSMKSLEAVEDFYKEIYHQVNTVNQAFATEKAANIDEMSTKATTQVKNAKDLKLLSPTGKEWAAMDGIRKFFWKNMKPLTVFEAIGSDELMSIFKRVLGGEDVWITDILEAKKVLDEAKKEFGYNKWNLKERREVTTADGSKVSLTLGEMMSLYAYMFREQAEEHLSVGGFVFAPDAKAIKKFKGSKALYKTHLNDQTPHRMRKQDIDKMSEMLTEEQRAYAKTVQEYLTKLGEKGNEVSRKLYGIDLFKETAYFPIKSSHDYIETSTGPSGDPNIKSRGTFKETVPGAGNPIVLEDFMEVVGNHVNTMATYHAFVLPVEDLTRVWNYTPVNIKRDENGKAILDENGMPVADTKGEAGYNSLKAEITKKYGKEANDYILQLLRDLNGGARRESASSILDKGITAFKRSATMLSLSTIVQQPTSIIRAMAYVDAKHFKGASFVPWETVKKYAPVAAIKEVGGHDTNTGARTVDYINAKEYDSIKDAAKAAVKPEIYGGDPNVRAEAFGWLTGKADEISWRYMFGAIINEQAERLGKPKDSEAVLKAAGERFADVVRHTQVYDSTLTRSEYMRSKDGLMKMATAFGAEPTTVISMAVDAIIKAERGDKTFFRKSAAGIAFSIIANAAVVSLIYAMRDDDEDETIPEKYVQSLTSELIEGFNPLEYLPIARDIMSMFKGYEIERSDMALIGNLMEQVELITSSKRSVPDKIFGVTGAVSAFFGLPVTNVYRDLKGLVNTGQSFIDAEEQTGAGLGHAMGDAVRGQFNLFSKIFGAESGNAYELYKAFVSGDTAHYDRVAARYESEAAVEQALRRELRERDRRIGEAAEARMAGELDVYESIIEQIAGEGIFDKNMIIRAINNEINSLKDDAKQENLVPKDEEAAAEDAEEVLSLYSTSDLNDALERGDSEDFSWIYQTLVTGKTEQGKTEAQAKAAVKSSVTAYWKKRYIEAWKSNDTAEIKRIQSILQSTGLYGSRNDVAKLGQDWVKKYAASGK